MTGYLVYDRQGAKVNHRYIGMHMDEGGKLGIKIVLLIREDLVLGVDGLGNRYVLHKNMPLEKPDFIIVRTIDPFFSRHIEGMGWSLFNNSFVSEQCNDKRKTYEYLASYHIPMIPSVFANYKEISSCLNRSHLNHVFKAVDGHGGKQVFLFDGKNGEEIKRGMEHSDFVIQPLYGNQKQDLRVYVIGKEIIAAILRTAVDGFKSNFSLGGKVEVYHLNEKEKKTYQSNYWSI